MRDKGGIVFYRTNMLDKLSEFYIGKIGCKLWIDQGGCKVFQFGNMLFGFCDREGEPNTGALITFFYQDRSEVDRMYELLKHKAKDHPVENPNYRIYHFYAVDPEGRPIEFQYFWDELMEF